MIIKQSIEQVPAMIAVFDCLMYAVLLFGFGRLRFELGRGQKTEEEDCK
jgi:hypothetical protein